LDFELISPGNAVISHCKRCPFINRAKSSSAETVPTRPEEHLNVLVRNKERSKSMRVVQALGHSPHGCMDVDYCSRFNRTPRPAAFVLEVAAQ
jgi:hypothetical protein